MAALRRGDQSYAIAKHYHISHQNVNTRDTNVQLFKVEVLSRKESNLERFISEGIWIEDSIKEGMKEQLNSKGEWGRIHEIKYLAMQKFLSFGLKILSRKA